MVRVVIVNGLGESVQVLPHRLWWLFVLLFFGGWPFDFLLYPCNLRRFVCYLEYTSTVWFI